MPRNAKWFPAILLTAALLGGPVVIAVLLSMLIDIATPWGLHGAALALVGALAIALSIAWFRWQAAAVSK